MGRRRGLGDGTTVDQDRTNTGLYSSSTKPLLSRRSFRDHPVRHGTVFPRDPYACAPRSLLNETRYSHPIAMNSKCPIRIWYIQHPTASHQTIGIILERHSTQPRRIRPTTWRRAHLATSVRKPLENSCPAATPGGRPKTDPNSSLHPGPPERGAQTQASQDVRAPAHRGRAAMKSQRCP